MPRTILTIEKCYSYLRIRRLVPEIQVGSVLNKVAYGRVPGENLKWHRLVLEYTHRWSAPRRLEGNSANAGTASTHLESGIARSSSRKPSHVASSKTRPSYQVRNRPSLGRIISSAAVTAARCGQNHQKLPRRRICRLWLRRLVYPPRPPAKRWLDDLTHTDSANVRARLLIGRQLIYKYESFLEFWDPPTNTQIAVMSPRVLICMKR